MNSKMEDAPTSIVCDLGASLSFECGHTYCGPCVKSS